LLVVVSATGLAFGPATSAPASTSRGKRLAPGDYSSSLIHDGEVRTYLVHVPPQALKARSLPLVLNFHGAGSDASQQERYSGMNATADRYGFVAVYPNGTGEVRNQSHLLTFNAGRCCPPASLAQVDDVGFVKAIIAKLETKLRIDALRIYATGMSNGGMMAHRLAAEDGDQFAAVASVAGQLDVLTFAPSTPVPVMEFHSADDPLAFYDGGSGTAFSRSVIRVLFPPVETGITAWAQADSCPTTPTVDPTITGAPGTMNAGETVTRIAYGPCADGSAVVLYKFTGSGHVWPGSTLSLDRFLGRATTLVDANDVMWQFFAAHPRRI
jgi:polyhydroxybutyrate depolymerase